MTYDLEFWGLQTLAMLVTAILIPGLRISGPLHAFFVVVALALFNTYFWDAALFFHVPDSASLHSLSLLVVNGILFWLIAKFLPGIEITGCLPAIAAPIVFTICSLVIQRYGRTIDWHKFFVGIQAMFFRVRSYFEQPKSERSSADLLVQMFSFSV